MLINSTFRVACTSAYDEYDSESTVYAKTPAAVFGGPLATAVVVTHQSGVTLEATIAGLRRCKAAQVLNCIFVDNGSTDGTASVVRREQGWAHTIFTGKNNGFGRGCNIGLEQVKTPYTLFLNPDAVIGPEAVRGMVAFLDANPNVGIVGPATYYGVNGRAPSHQVTSALPTPWGVVKASMPLMTNTDFARPIVPGSAPFKTGWVCGAVMMVRTDMIRQLGGFDPRFFLYSEETDLCLRAAEAGYETWALGTVTARHIGGASTANRTSKKSGCIGKHYYQSRHYYMVKHHGRWAAAFAEIGEFGFLCLGTFADVVCGKGTARLQARLQAPLFSQPEMVPQLLAKGSN